MTMPAPPIMATFVAADQTPLLAPGFRMGGMLRAAVLITHLYEVPLAMDDQTVSIFAVLTDLSGGADGRSGSGSPRQLDQLIFNCRHRISAQIRGHRRQRRTAIAWPVSPTERHSAPFSGKVGRREEL